MVVGRAGGMVAVLMVAVNGATVVLVLLMLLRRFPLATRASAKVVEVVVQEVVLFAEKRRMNHITKKVMSFCVIRTILAILVKMLL